MPMLDKFGYPRLRGVRLRRRPYEVDWRLAGVAADIGFMALGLLSYAPQIVLTILVLAGIWFVVGLQG